MFIKVIEYAQGCPTWAQTPDEKHPPDKRRLLFSLVKTSYVILIRRRPVKKLYLYLVYESLFFLYKSFSNRCNLRGFFHISHDCFIPYKGMIATPPPPAHPCWSAFTFGAFWTHLCMYTVQDRSWFANRQDTRRRRNTCLCLRQFRASLIVFNSRLLYNRFEGVIYWLHVKILWHCPLKKKDPALAFQYPLLALWFVVFLLKLHACPQTYCCCSHRFPALEFQLLPSHSGCSCSLQGFCSQILSLLLDFFFFHVTTLSKSPNRR